jgi:hypothetical protein
MDHPVLDLFHQLIRKWFAGLMSCKNSTTHAIKAGLQVSGRQFTVSNTFQLFFQENPPAFATPL